MSYGPNLYDDTRNDIQLITAYLDDKFDSSISNTVLSGHLISLKTYETLQRSAS